MIPNPRCCDLWSHPIVVMSENRIPDLLTVPLIPIPWLMIPNPRCCDLWSHPIVVMSENRIPDLLTVPLIPIPWLMIPNPRCCDSWSHPILCCRSLISYVSLQPCNRYTTQGLPEVSLPLEIRGVAWDFEDVRMEIKVGPLKVLQTREVRCGHAPAENVSNFRSQKCHFLRFPQEIFSK